MALPLNVFNLAIIFVRHLNHNLKDFNPNQIKIFLRRMRDAGNALRSAGLKRGEVILLVRRHPPVLGRDPSLLINLLSFLKYNCGLHKVTFDLMGHICSRVMVILNILLTFLLSKPFTITFNPNLSPYQSLVQSFPLTSPFNIIA